MGTTRVTLVSIGAKHVHKTLAPWCLKAYCDAQGFSGVEIVETHINSPVEGIVEAIYNTTPQVVGFSCYIWNIELVCKIGGLLKELLPHASIVLGGPEVSFEADLERFPFADYIIKGQGERAFYELLKRIGKGEGKNGKRIIDGYHDNFADFPSPFTSAYFDSFVREPIPQIENRLVYYESTRGCPFSCAYCLSSAESGVQVLPVERVKEELRLFVLRGARCVKFVDRTFNADKNRAAAILEFIGSLDTDCTFHFEAAADLFDDRLLEIIKAMPIGRVQFEIGVQSVHPETLAATARTTDTERVLATIRTLSSFQNCHIHADLIAGLPHETLQSFRTAIDRCIKAEPHALQIGFLKRLKGTRIDADSATFGALFADFPPYEVYKTDTMLYEDICTFKRIAHAVDKYYNSGLYVHSVRYGIELFGSPCRFFEALAACCARNGFVAPVSLKKSYATMLECLLSANAPRRQAEHCIKLDCLSCDPKGQLPDTVKPCRDKRMELIYGKKNLPAGSNFRIEFFEADETYKLFLYDKKNPITNRFSVRMLNNNEKDDG